MIKILRFATGFFIVCAVLIGCTAEASEIPPSDNARTAMAIAEQNQEYVEDRNEEITIKFAGALNDARIKDYAVLVYVNEINRIEAERAAAAAEAARQASYVPTQSSSAYVGGGGGGNLASIRACESGGNYATNTGNGYYGAYQFDQQTWNSVGGSGNPANASPAEQDARANALIAQRGTSPWPNCG